MKRFWLDLRQFWTATNAFRIYKRMDPATIETIYAQIDSGRVKREDWVYVLTTARI